MPLKLIPVICKIFFNLLRRHIFIHSDNPPLQKSFRQFYVLVFLNQLFFRINCKTIFRMTFQLVSDILLHSCPEISSILYYSFTIKFGKQLLVYLSINKPFNFFDNKTIIFPCSFCLLFLHTQHSCKVSFIRICLSCIKLHFFTRFFPLESIQSIFIFHIMKRHWSIFILNTFFFYLSFFIQFNQFTFQVLSSLNLLYRHHIAVVLTDTFNLLVKHLIIYSNRIKRNLLPFAHLCINLRSKSNIIHKFQLFIL